MSLSPFSMFYLHTLARRLAAQQRAAWQQGRRPLLEEILQLEPLLREQLPILTALVCDEMVLREQFGEEVDPADYARRFPELTDLLKAELQPRTAARASPTATAGTFGNAPSFAAGITPGNTTVDDIRALPQIPGYQLLDELGRGGMGVVYLARQVGLNRLVALKMILHAEYAGSEERNRFEREAQAIARLRHENIVEIYEIGRHEGKPFFSLGYVPGGSLDRRLAGNPQQPRAAALVVRKLAQAIQVAHQAGLVHRDLKPANVLLEESSATPLSECHPRISDFGLARAMDEQGYTLSGAVMGTPSYMAPEQAEGKSRTVGPLADVWALGAILYEMLTGRPPFKAATMLDTVKLVLETEPVSVRQLQPHTAHDLETICLKCLQKDPTQRYTSAAALAEDLRRWLDGEAILARPVSPIEHAWRWCRRNGVLAAALGAVAAALVLGSVVALLFALSAQTARKHTENALLEVEREKQEAQRQLVRAEAARHAFQINKGVRAWEDNDLLRAEGLASETAATFSGSWEQRHLSSLNARRSLPLATQFGAILALAYHPGSRRLASAHADRRVVLWDEGRAVEVHRLPAQPQLLDALAWNVAGTTLATGNRDGLVTLWPVHDFRNRRDLPRRDGPIFSLAFDPQGKYLAVGSGESDVYLWDIAEGKWRAGWKGHTGAVRTVAFAPNGKLLATGSVDFQVKIWDVATGNELRTLRGPTNWVRTVAFSPDGTTLASGGNYNSVLLWDVATGNELHSLEGHKDWVVNVAFSRSGKALLSASDDGTVKVWNVRSGEDQATLRGHRSTIRCAVWGADDQSLFSGGDDQQLRRWNLARGQYHHTWSVKRGFIQALAVSPQGQQVAGGDSHGRVTVWTLAGQEVVSYSAHEQAIECLAYSPDGSRLVTGSLDETARIWERAGGQLRATLSSRGGLIAGVAWSPNGQRLVTGTGTGTLLVWDAATGQERRRIEAHEGSLRAVAFAPDGATVATAAGTLNQSSVIKMWDPTTGALRHTLAGHGEAINGLAFSPDGSQIVSASDDGTLKLWILATNQERVTLQGHDGRVLSVVWLPDGRRILSGSADGTLKLWDARSGQEVLTLRGHTDVVNSVVCSPDGKLLFSAGADRTVKLWSD